MLVFSLKTVAWGLQRRKLRCGVHQLSRLHLSVNIFTPSFSHTNILTSFRLNIENVNNGR